MNNIEKILIERDGLTKNEARLQFNYVKELIEQANGNYNEIEEIMLYELGLEMDYIFEFI